MKKYLTFLSAAVAVVSLFPACMKETTEDYTEWREANEDFMAKKETEMTDGKAVFTKIVPSWENGSFILMQWHNDRSLTEQNLTPLYNSTVKLIYDGELMDGTSFGSSADAASDAIYEAKPSENITGFATAVMNMHVGDTVTTIIPWQLGYGIIGSGDKIKPYSTLVFHIRLKEIVDFEKE